MADLVNLSVAQLGEVSADIDRCANGSRTMEESAQRVVTCLFDMFKDNETGARDIALVRCFKTHRYSDLPDDLQSTARQIQDGIEAEPGVKCLALLGTAGIEPAWNSRLSSAGHKAIPLPSPAIVGRFPMISQVMAQLGVDIKRVLRPSHDLIVDMQERTYNVFYVADAQGSPHIPAQEQFVKPFGIRSVIGFGGVLPSGDLFVVVIFSKVEIPRSKAELFKALAVTVKTALLPFDFDEVFATTTRVASR